MTISCVFCVGTQGLLTFSFDMGSNSEAHGFSAAQLGTAPLANDPMRRLLLKAVGVSL